MENIGGFDFVRLHLDAEGARERDQEAVELSQRAGQATDAVFIAHGFRNDENDATALYTRFLQNLRQHVDGPLHASL